MGFDLLDHPLQHLVAGRIDDVDERAGQRQLEAGEQAAKAGWVVGAESELDGQALKLRVGLQQVTQPLTALADQLRVLKANSAQALNAYIRSVRLKLFQGAEKAVMEVEP